MGPVKKLIAAIAIASITSTGCIHFPGSPEGKKPMSKSVEAPVETGVEQAGAKIPVTTTSSVASLAKFVAKTPGKNDATDFALAWQKKIAYLPDPTKNGAMLPGVVGQMFLFTAEGMSASANGKLVIEMFDMTGRATGSEAGERLGTWTFDKETLKRLQTMDEIVGKTYAVFLPWPHYDAKVTRVKITGRFEPERGYPLFAGESELTFDTRATENPTVTRTQGVGAPIGAGFGGVPPTTMNAPRALPALDPVPVGGRSATGATLLAPPPMTTPLPSNLPPLVVTPGPR
jgi:hypothetical protein